MERSPVSRATPTVPPVPDLSHVVSPPFLRTLQPSRREAVAGGAEHLADARALAALVVRAGSRVLLLGRDDEQGLEEALQACDCTVQTVSVLHGVEDFRRHEQWSFDAALFADGLDQLEDPAGTLRAISAAISEEGQLVVTVANATHWATRARFLRGAPPCSEEGVPARLYDLPALERVIQDAGLRVSEVFRVSCPPGCHGDDILIGLPDQVRQEVTSGAEAHSQAFVVVAGHRRLEAASVSAATHLEQLQSSLAEARRQAAEREKRYQALVRLSDELRTRGDELEVSLEQAQRDAEELRATVAEREEALRERMAELEQAHVERRHLELDIVVKDAFIAELRAHGQEREAELERLRPAESALREVEVLRDTLGMRRHVIAEALHAGLRRLPVAHRALSSAARVLDRLRDD